MMNYHFNQEEIKNIVNRFGKEFYEKVISDINIYAEKWGLTAFQLVPSFSANLVFICNSANFGNVVLKIGNTVFKEIITEGSTLQEYRGTRFCKILEADIENGVILLECVQPGNTLREEKSVEKRLTVFSDLYNHLHIMPKQAERYPTYIGWVTRITEYMSRRQDFKELSMHMKKAEEICVSVSNLYPKKMLLHGDFHHDNILLGERGDYKIIDPKGVIGDPVFDVPRFILNEFDEELTTESQKKIEDIIVALEKSLGIPKHIIKQCLYVETTMGMCWCVESNATPEEAIKLLENVALAEAIMNS